jgi:hypothetical protein
MGESEQKLPVEPAQPELPRELPLEYLTERIRETLNENYVLKPDGMTVEDCKIHDIISVFIGCFNPAHERIAELGSINEQHRIINGDLRGQLSAMEAKLAEAIRSREAWQRLLRVEIEKSTDLEQRLVSAPELSKEEIDHIMPANWFRQGCFLCESIQAKLGWSGTNLLIDNPRSEEVVCPYCLAVVGKHCTRLIRGTYPQYQKHIDALGRQLVHFTRIKRAKKERK